MVTGIDLTVFSEMLDIYLVIYPPVLIVGFSVIQEDAGTTTITRLHVVKSLTGDKRKVGGELRTPSVVLLSTEALSYSLQCR